MKNFADNLGIAIKQIGNPCIVGIDPRLDLVPNFISSLYNHLSSEDASFSILRDFCYLLLECVSGKVAAVKIQIAFFERHGLAGLKAFDHAVRKAKELGIIVIADVKRSDISNTAEAYAKAFLGNNPGFSGIDCITVNPYFGLDSIEPFVKICKNEGKGIFILVKTSNPGSADIQDLIIGQTGRPLYEHVARMVSQIGSTLIGENGYSSVGAVVGATHPIEAAALRKLLTNNYLLVPGYGTQGASAQDVTACFNSSGEGAIVNASRSIIFPHKNNSISKSAYLSLINDRLSKMISEIKKAINNRT
jgi:orotidine-5'-phosphate decarboxylase